MKYQGSKSKIAKEILAKINPNPNKTWIEPFVGGCGMIKHVNCKERIGSDNNNYIISLWKAIQRGWEPPYVFKSEYDDIKSDPRSFEQELVAFAAVGCSFQGGWFNGYTNKTITKEGNIRDYVDESRRSIIKLKPLINNIKLVNCSYDELPLPNKDSCIIYCDPPYQSTKKYAHDFDHDKFWDWCRRKSIEGYEIYISEYNAPDDFKCILEINRTQSMSHKKVDVKPKDKLFIYNPINSK